MDLSMLEPLVANLDLILGGLMLIALVYEIVVYVSKLLFREVYVYQSDYMRTPRKIGRLMKVFDRGAFKNPKSSKKLFKCIIATKTKNPLAPERNMLLVNKGSIVSQDRTSITFNKSNMFWLASNNCFILTEDFTDSQKENPMMVNMLIEGQLVSISSNAMKSAEASPPLIHQTYQRTSLPLSSGRYNEDEEKKVVQKSVYDIETPEDEFIKIISQDLPSVDEMITDEDRDFMPSKRNRQPRVRPARKPEIDEGEDVHNLKDDMGDFVG